MFALQTLFSRSRVAVVGALSRHGKVVGSVLGRGVYRRQPIHVSFSPFLSLLKSIKKTIKKHFSKGKGTFLQRWVGCGHAGLRGSRCSPRPVLTLFGACAEPPAQVARTESDAPCSAFSFLSSCQSECESE